MEVTFAIFDSCYSPFLCIDLLFIGICTAFNFLHYSIKKKVALKF
ncbi:hypothetical protein HMPREF9495_02881 [Enterococcus faecalis TX2141]|nr:hypothetical protein HMPREF9495_02881 [Enterococcus faecalis TX2141]